MSENNAQTSIKYPNTSEQTDWLIKTRNGQQHAFNNIVQKYQQSIYNLCYRMLSDAYEAEDAAQEIFMEAYTRLDSYDSKYIFSTWPFQLLRTTVLIDCGSGVFAGFLLITWSCNTLSQPKKHFDRKKPWLKPKIRKNYIHCSNYYRQINGPPLSCGIGTGCRIERLPKPWIVP